MDTQMAIGLIASNLHLGQQVFGFAGNKIFMLNERQL